MKTILHPALLLFTLTLLSCGHNESHTIAASKETAIDSMQGSCPYLAKDNKNNIVLSWIKKIDSTSYIFCYAISKDGGKTFGKRVEIPGSTNIHPHGENLPKVIFKSSGEIIAVWGAANPNPENAYSGLVYYSQSFDEGSSWSSPRLLTNDKKSFDQRYFDVSLLPDGEVGIVWLDNRKRWDGDGSGLFYALTKGRDGFQQEKMISGPCCQCCRTVLYIDKKKNMHVLYRAIINDSIRDIVHIVSTDDGRSFTAPQRLSADNWVINGCPHTGPAMTEAGDVLHFTWFTGGNPPGIYYNRSEDKGSTFTARDTVSGRMAKHCQIATFSNDHLMIVWNETFRTGDTSCSRIGLEERNTKGEVVHRQYITSESSNSSFPVISVVDENKAVVAYTETVGDRQYVIYKSLF